MAKKLEILEQLVKEERIERQKSEAELKSQIEKLMKIKII